MALPANEAMVKVQLENLDLSQVTRGFELYESSSRRVAMWCRQYQTAMLDEKVNMILKAATTRPKLLAEAMLRMKDSGCDYCIAILRYPKRLGSGSLQCAFLGKLRPAILSSE